MTDETPLDAPQDDEQPDTEASTPDEPEDTAEGEPETFDREYVQKLREESKGYRTKLRDAEAKAEQYAHQLHAALVRADGRLHNPDDLPFHDDHLTDSDALTAGIDAVLLDRPYLGRSPNGDVGQGKRGGSEEPFSLLGRLRNSV